MADWMKERIGVSMNEYVLKSRIYQSKVARTFLLFAFIAFICYASFIIMFSDPVGMATVACLSVFFVFLFLYRQYAVERKYRGINVEFGFYAKNSPSGYIIIFLSTTIMTTFLIPVLLYLFGNPGFIVLLVIIAAESIILYMLRPMKRTYLRNARSVEDPEILQDLSRVAADMGMEPLVPVIFAGKDLKIANAACAGLLKPRIHISDYLYENLSREELVSVIVHEYVHAKSKHKLKIFLPIVIVYLIFGSLYAYSQYLIISHTYSPLGIFGLFGILVIALAPYIFYLPRTRQETEADRKAAMYAGKDNLISALSVISYLNLIPPSTGGLSHPSLTKRIKNIRSAGTKNI